MCLSLFAATPAVSSTSANVKTFESTQQQKQAIKGVVKDTHDEPVIGASVMVNGVAMAVTMLMATSRLPLHPVLCYK